MSIPDHTSGQDDGTRGAFPRIELPPVPSLGRMPRAEQPRAEVPVATPPAAATQAPATSLDGHPVGGHDEPPFRWHYPYEPAAGAAAAPATSGYTFQVVPPPVPVQAAPPMPDPLPVAAPVAAITVPVPAPAAPAAPYVLPELTAVSTRDAASDALDDADVGPSRAVLVLFAVLVVALLWASRMAFSAGLLAFASLLMAELALASSFARRSGASRPAAATLLAVGATAIALNAARHAFGQFGDSAFVAGLFVLVTGVPTLLLLGVATLLLRRARQPSRAVDALRAGSTLRFVALGALLAAGVQAHRTFSAKPDAIVALGIVALAVLVAVSVLRGTGRAAMSDRS